MADDIVARIMRMQEDIRRLKLRAPGLEMPLTVPQSFIVGGQIATSLYIPPHIIGMDAFNAVNLDGVERKFLVNVRNATRVGTATITWKVNSMTYTNGTAVELFDDDRILATVASVASDPEDLTATFTIAYFPNGGGPS